jgi:hypothetical protein
MTCSTGQRPLLIPTERASFAITPPTVVARLLFQDMPSTIGPGTVLANSQEGAESVQKTSGNEQTRQTHSNGSAEQSSLTDGSHVCAAVQRLVSEVDGDAEARGGHDVALQRVAPADGARRVLGRKVAGVADRVGGRAARTAHAVLRANPQPAQNTPLCFGVSFMFVPSLSWQSDRLYMETAQQRRFSHRSCRTM